MTSQPDPKDGPRRLLWEAIQLLRGAPSITARQDAAIRLVDRRIDEFEAALRVVPPEGGPPSDGMPSEPSEEAVQAAWDWLYPATMTCSRGWPEAEKIKLRGMLKAAYAAERGVSAVPPTEGQT